MIPISWFLLENFGLFLEILVFLANFKFNGIFFSLNGWLFLCLCYFGHHLLTTSPFRHNLSIEILITNNFVSFDQQKQRKNPIKQTFNCPIVFERLIHHFTPNNTSITIYTYIKYNLFFHHFILIFIIILTIKFTFAHLYVFWIQFDCCLAKKKHLNDGQNECAVNLYLFNFIISLSWYYCQSNFNTIHLFFSLFSGVKFLVNFCFR